MVCPHCGHGGLAAEPSLQAVYDKIELPPITPIMTRVQQYGGRCAGCGRPYVAPVPAGMEPGSPFGASVQRLATYLRYTPAISYERLSALFAQVFGLSISEGGLANLFQSVRVRLDDRIAEILTRLRSSRLICSDETSARVNGRTPWEWVFQHAAVCVHVIRPSRGHEVIHEVLGDHRPTIWVSDLSSAQKQHPAAPWQVCLAHQWRDCQFAIDAGDVVFAPRMKAVLLRAFAIHQRRDTLAASTLYQYRCDLRRRVNRCLARQPTNRHGRRLQKRDAKIQDHLFLFLDDAAIPPTNNSSEQAIRMSTVFRKVTNGFRSHWGRDLFAAVRSVVNTGKRQGMSAYQALQKALSPSSSVFEPS
jgi:transposase